MSMPFLLRARPHVAEPAITVTDYDVPPGNGLPALSILDHARGFNLVESLLHDPPNRIESGRRSVNEDKRAANELVRIPQRIRPPEVVLAPAVADGQAQRIDGRVALAVEAQLARKRPTRCGED